MGQVVDVGAPVHSKGNLDRLPDAPVVGIAPRIDSCPACETPNPSISKFCRDCGARLRTPARDFASCTPPRSGEAFPVAGGAAGFERRTSTVLFADVSGFTAMSERLDPEDVFDIMDRAFAIMLDEVHRHEGTINQFLGDGVMALFESVDGIDDHAYRALAAARAIQEGLKPLGDEVCRTYEVDFRMRIGIHTGPIVVGAIGGNLRVDYTALSRTTRVAARLLSVAQPGEIVVSGDTRRLAERFFSFQDLGDFAADGAAGFTDAYAVISDIVEDFYGVRPKGFGPWAVPELLCA